MQKLNPQQRIEMFQPTVLMQLTFAILLLSLVHEVGSNYYIGSRCSNAVNYTAESRFEKNMQRVFGTLISQAPPSGFSNTTEGQDPDRVYGLVQCRGDVLGNECLACINISVVAVVKYCPNAVDAIIWYEKCQLRYSNTNFFGAFNIDDSNARYWEDRNATDPALLSSRLGKLLNNLSAIATADPSSFEFAAGEIDYTDLSQLYGMLQCTRDTSLADCKYCLSFAVSEIPRRCGLQERCDQVWGSCRLRFDTHPFQLNTPTPKLAPLPNSTNIPTAVGTNFYINSRCNNAATSTAGGKFELNMQEAFTKLISDTPLSGFSNSTAGQDPYRVYAIAQCRGDILQEACRSCVSNATTQIFSYCPHALDAIVWYERCQLRYSNINFFGSLNVEDTGSWVWLNRRATDPALFNRLLGSLLKNLTSLATTKLSGVQFAVGETGYTVFDNIYALVQCTMDTSLVNCRFCLENAIADIPTTCSDQEGCEVVKGSCRVRFDTMAFYLERTTLPAPSPPSSNPSNTASKQTSAATTTRSRRTLVIRVSILASLASILFILAAFVISKRAKTQGRTPSAEEEFESRESLIFNLDSIRASASNFSQANKLGEGGYGPVYRGKLQDGQEIAVKRLSSNSGQGATEFKNEVKLVAKLQHRNLVRLLGCCIEGQEKILVYEYVPNGSLDKFLFDPEKRVKLDWITRAKIINGIARGLLYLHEDSRLKIIHRDLKASNILLDKDMNSKISDFGLAKLVGMDETHGNTSRIAGTYGYMSPEYAMEGLFSVKSDVFSFGVLVLEIVSGQKNVSFDQSQRGQGLLDYAWSLWRENRATELLDGELSQSCQSEVLKCIHIGLLCVQQDPALRPTMSSVVVMLSTTSLTLSAPSTPAFFVGRSRMQRGSSTSGSSAATMESDGPNGTGSTIRYTDDVTISELHAR